MWIKIDDNHKPEIGKVVCGLWKEQSMLCYRRHGDQYVDVFHNCNCYMPPLKYAELPEDL